MVTPPAGPTGPAGPGKPPAPPRPQPEALSSGKTKPTQVPVVTTLPSGETVTGIVRTPAANLTERAIKTLGQAFIGTFATVYFGGQSLGMPALKAAGFAAGSATLAALLSLVQNLIFGKVKA